MSRVPPVQPQIESDLASNPLFAVRQDAGPFLKLGNQFSCNGAQWFGPTAISPTALYVLKKTKNHNTHGGGIAGALLASALAKDDQLATCTAGDLPQPVRAVLDPKGKLGKKTVVIIPKATVSFVKASAWNNQITVNAGSDKFKVATSFFRMFSTPGNVANLGWTLNVPLNPTAAPVHDMRSEEERAAAAAKPLWQRILYVLLAIGLIILVIAIRVIARR